MKKFIPLFVMVLMLSLFASPVFALGTNGSFETGTDPGLFSTLAPGDTNIDSWDVESGTIDYIGTYWSASDGVRSIDLSGNAVGSVSQTFDTTVGATYEVTFDMAGNPAGGSVEKTMNVEATGNSAQGYSFDTTGKTLNDMGWTSKTYTFTATAASTTLTFTSTTASAYGPALDNVAITEESTPDEDPDEDEDDETGRPTDNHGYFVSTAEKADKHDVAKSRDGMPTQSKGHTK